SAAPEGRQLQPRRRAPQDAGEHPHLTRRYHPSPASPAFPPLQTRGRVRKGRGRAMRLAWLGKRREPPSPPMKKSIHHPVQWRRKSRSFTNSTRILRRSTVSRTIDGSGRTHKNAVRIIIFSGPLFPIGKTTPSSLRDAPHLRRPGTPCGGLGLGSAASISAPRAYAVP